MKIKRIFSTQIFILLVIFSFMNAAAVYAQTDDKAEQVRNELIKYHVKSKKSALQGVYINLTMSALSLALGEKLKDKNAQRNLYVSGAMSFFSALYGTWQVFNEKKIIKNVQSMDMQNADVNAIARGLNKNLKWQKLWIYFGLASSAYGIGINIYNAEHFKLAIGKEDHKNELRGLYYLRSAVSGYSLYDGWRKLGENKRDTLRLKEIMQ